MSLDTSNVLHKSRNPTKVYMMNCYPASVMLSERGGLVTAVQQRDSLSSMVFFSMFWSSVVAKSSDKYYNINQMGMLQFIWLYSLYVCKHARLLEDPF